MGDLMEWGERMTHGERRWENVPQTSWDAAGDRFFRALAALDAALAADVTAPLPLEVIFQGPVADALAHVGQLTMMRGMAAVPDATRELRARQNRRRTCRTRPGSRSAWSSMATRARRSSRTSPESSITARIEGHTMSRSSSAFCVMFAAAATFGAAPTT